MPDLRTELLFEIRADLGEVQEVGATPAGFRRVRLVKGGVVSGPKLAAEVLPGGGDWLLIRGDGVRALDVRITFRADDGHLVYAAAEGLLAISPETFARVLAGEDVDPSEYYFRTTPRFETASEKYAWLNRVVAVSVGRFTAAAVYQTVYAVL
ncbi:MAG TPA: DUF3237 domain-containing protein [Thermoanaerobaculia bacterium]|nr:DUF3237 domain-containing protein [Thermoanaerobaculia bacterium]